MQDFSQWMTTLQQQQQQQQRGSPASSYAETDSDSDSDCDGLSPQLLDAKRRHVAKDAQRAWKRTAPICIPSSGGRVHPHLQADSPVESPDLSFHADRRLLRAGRYLHVDSTTDAAADDELDEDDPAFYGNLAFFRSQYGDSQAHLRKRSVDAFKAAPVSPTAVDARSDDDDDDIFAMEL